MKPKVNVITEFRDGMYCTYSDIEEMLREVNKNSTLPHRAHDIKQHDKKQQPVKREKKPEYELHITTMKGVDERIVCKDRTEVVNQVQMQRKKYGAKLVIELLVKGKSVGKL